MTKILQTAWSWLGNVVHMIESRTIANQMTYNLEKEIFECQNDVL